MAITPCGKYVHGTEYDILSEVLNATDDGGDGCSYISIKRNMNVKPGTDPTVWAISTQRGEPGEPGEPGSGFSYVEVTVDSSSGTPSATCRIENDTFYLDFFGLKGADGSPGVQGPPGQDGQPGQDGHDGVDGIGFASISTPATPDGTAQITLTDGNVITLDLNHNHSQYPRYMLLEDEIEYDDIEVKEPDMLYLIINANPTPPSGGSS